MSFTPGFNIGAGVDPKGKFYGMPKLLEPKNNDGREAQVDPNNQNLTGVFWTQKTDEKGKVEEFKIDTNDSTRFSTAVSLNKAPAQAKITPAAALNYAREKLDRFKEELYGKALENYREAFRNTKHYNALIARVAADIGVAVNARVLSMLGVRPEEFANIQQEIIEEMRAALGPEFDEVIRAGLLGEMGIG